MNDKERNRLKESLLQYRHRLIDERSEINRKWRELHQPVVETEEAAQQDTVSRTASMREHIGIDEIEAVDSALGKIDSGTYGTCEGCGESIAAARLAAVPWARCCSTCRQEHDPPAAVEEEVPFSATLQVADELLAEVSSILRAEGIPAVDLEEITMFADGDTVVVEGVVPSEQIHAAVIDATENCSGAHDIRDDVRVDPHAWQQVGRTPPEEQLPPQHERMYGEESEEDAFESITSGEPMMPPDRKFP